MRRLRLGLYFAFAALCLLAVTWPGHAFVVSELDILVLGVPSALVWNVAWVLLSFVALTLLYLTEP